MKEKLLALIDEADNIEKQFHTVGADTKGFPSMTVIYDVKDFQCWIAELELELQDIVNRTNDPYITETLQQVKKRFDGSKDKSRFREILARLSAIKSVIDKYYQDEATEVTEEGHQPKIFISHSSKDVKYVEEIVKLLVTMGLDNDTVFCSSLPGYDIPIGCDIYDYLLEQFYNYDLHIFFVHSQSYYDSAVSLNEMGAAWALKNEYTSFLLPGFNFADMKGVVTPNKIAIKMDIGELELKNKLNQLYDMISGEFGVKRRTDIIWEKNRDAFIENIKSID